MGKNIIRISFSVLILFTTSELFSQISTGKTASSESIKEYHSSTLELKSNTIPDSVFLLTNLISLSIQGMDCDYVITDENGKDITQCWMIHKIPPQIKNLKKLESLRLNVNAINRIPGELAELKNLKSLDLNDNPGLSNIDNITRLSNLEELGVFGCGLTSLPSNIGELKKLKYLGLSGNHIDKIELLRIRKALPNCEVVF